MWKWIAAWALAVFSGASYAQQDGDLREMSMSMAEGNDPLVPMMNNKVCVPGNKNASDKMFKPDDDRNCKSDVKTSGKITRHKTVCVNDGETMTMEGVQELLGPDHFKSDRTLTVENRKGKEMTRQAMTMKKLGACKVDPGPAAGMMNQMKQMCGEMAESLHAPSFLDKKCAVQGGQAAVLREGQCACGSVTRPGEIQHPDG